MRFSTIGLRGVGLLLAAVSASLAASPVAFEKHVLTDQYYCDGINAGDINRDGRPDIVAGPFWYEGSDFQDGDNDVITALDAHGWGLAWFEQVRRDGQITFVQHTIMEDHATEAKYSFHGRHHVDRGVTGRFHGVGDPLVHRPGPKRLVRENTVLVTPQQVIASRCTCN